MIVAIRALVLGALLLVPAITVQRWISAADARSREAEAQPPGETGAPRPPTSATAAPT
jgi:hypothetical protein